MNHNGNQIESRLWAAADELRANSKLKSSEYSVPVLGLVFLRYADHKFKAAVKDLAGKSSGRRTIGPADYQARGVLYLPEAARFSALIQLPEGANIGTAINDAMRAIEAENPDLKDVLPKTYNRFENALLKELLKTMNSVPMDIEGDAFGKIYEYFLGHFAMSEGQKGGEFFTPTAIVQLIVGIIQPFHGRIFDPACGSGGMFVQSARFVEEHRNKQLPSPSGRGAGGEGGSAGTLSVYGQEKVAETVRLGKMNLAVHGLAGDIRQGNTYYEDLHRSTGKFDFVMANPPFNVDRVDKDRLKDDPRFPFGLPRTDNANYLWIQLFYSALNATGRSGFVMANSASDARGSELDIRKQLIDAHAVDVMVAVGSNFFYTVTLPCTLWFMDKAKATLPPCPPSPPPSPKGRGRFAFQGMVEEARKLRKKQTPAEEAMWELLRNRKLADLKFRRQHQLGDYIIDFFCAQHNLILELDGPVHDLPDRKKHDQKRDAYLKSSGYTVIRFQNDDVYEKTQQILEAILTHLPSPFGRGARGEGLTEEASSQKAGTHGARTRDTVLFIDARHIFRQIDRAHRDWTPAQIEFLANIARLYRGEEPENLHDSADLLAEHGFLPSTSGRGAGGEGARYIDVPSMCKVATLSEIEAQGWSLNPGRYVGVAARAEDDFDFKERLEEQNEELETLNAEARELKERIAENVAKLLEGE